MRREIAEEAAPQQTSKKKRAEEEAAREAKEAKEKKAKEKGPAWVYVVEPVTKPVVKEEVEDPNRMVGQVVNSRACNKCEEVNGEPVLKCRSCSTHFHLSCLGLKPGQAEESFKCSACIQAR